MAHTINIPPKPTPLEVLPLLPNIYTVAYPPTEPDKVPEPIEYFPLPDILTRGWTTDTHMTAYSVEVLPYRLSKEAVHLEGGVRMVAYISDVDCAQSHAASGGHSDVPAPDTWWLAELVKVHQLLEAFPGAFIYRTRGGYRIIYLLANPRVLCSAADVDTWKAEYLAWIAALRLRFGIYADPSCNDWPRLYRCPHATRSPGGRSEDMETLGSPYDIGAWTCEPTVEERELGKTLAKRPSTKPSRQYHESPVNAGDGVLFHAFQARGWIGKAIETGKWAVQCPWDDQHTKGEAFDTSTILYAPGPGHTLGYLHCAHAHCQTRDSRDVIAVFSRAELDTAERAAGVLPFQPASNGQPEGEHNAAEIRDEPSEVIPLSTVHETFQRYFYMPDTSVIDVCLAAYIANWLPGDPTWLQVIGPPSGGKTEPAMTLRALPHVCIVSTMTEAALLSGTPKKDKAQGAKGGLLRELGRFGVLVCKDFTSILSMRHEQRTALLAHLRDIYDGHMNRQVGVDGGKSLLWEGKLGFLAMCTDAIDSHHAVMAAMGHRFLFYRLPEATKDDRRAQAATALKARGQEAGMRKELATLVQKFFAGIEIPKELPELAESDEQFLITLADFTTQCRSAVERDGYRREMENIHGAELPARLVKALAHLHEAFRLMGIPIGRARQLLASIALDSIPKVRRLLLHQLAGKNFEITTRDLATAIGYPTETARRSLEDLAAQHVIERSSAKGNMHLWRIKEDLRLDFQVIQGFSEKSLHI